MTRRMVDGGCRPIGLSCALATISNPWRCLLWSRHMGASFGSGHIAGNFWTSLEEHGFFLSSQGHCLQERPEPVGGVHQQLVRVDMAAPV